MGIESKGNLIDAGLLQVEIHGEMQMQAFMKFKEEDGNSVSWKKFVFKKDGSKNKSTEDALKLLGFPGFEDSDAVVALNNGEWDTLLDTEKTYDLTIEITEGKDGKTYRNVEWVNDPDNPKSFGEKVSDDLLMKKFGFSAKAKEDEIPF